MNSNVSFFNIAIEFLLTKRFEELFFLDVYKLRYEKQRIYNYKNLYSDGFIR